MGLNKGEWSELYALFYLLENRNLKIVDSELKVINETIFEVQGIYSKKKEGIISFKCDDINIYPNVFGEEITPIAIDEISKFKDDMLIEIKQGGNGKGSFEIPLVEKWLKEKNILINYKAESGLKEDLVLINLDMARNEHVTLGYSVKSQIGSPATILNASKHTNFIYEVTGLNYLQVEEINSISTSTKLKDRMNRIKQLGGKIKFHSVESDIFNKNLEMIDVLLPKALAEVLLLSYTENIKDLNKLFEMTHVYNDKDIINKKLTDFLLAASLGMFPGKKWDGTFKANGGLIVVSINSHVYILDFIYYPKYLKEYLINETKLDSPSSKRYDMLNLKIKDGKIYFTLNLQVRYK